MKKYLCIITLLMVAFVSGAVTVTDNFDRADTTYSTNGADIGTHWFTSLPENDWQLWRIKDNVIESEVGNALDERGQTMLLNDTVETQSGNGYQFTVSADVMTGGSNFWGGIVFHYQNPSNYYTARIKGDNSSYQLLRIVDGSTSGGTFINKTDAVEPFSSTNFYTLTVTSDAAGQFSLSITKQGESTVLNPSTFTSDNTFSGGYAGLYNTSYGAADVDCSYDNFFLEVEAMTGDVQADDFNRADTPFSTNAVDVAANIGPDWVNAAGNGAWQVTNNILVADSLVSPAILYNTGMETVSGNGTNFVLKSDVLAYNNGVWAGVVFNYQDPSNYYAVRIKPGTTSYQFLTVANGTNANYISRSDAAVTFASDTFYTITVTSDSEHIFNVAITDLGGSDVLNPVQVVSDNGKYYKGGYAGVYTPQVSASPDVAFDNVLLNVDVLPGTLVADDFNRADVPYTADGSQVRSDWTAVNGGTWAIDGQELAFDGDAGGQFVLFNTSQENKSGDGYGFTLKADVIAQLNGWGGIIFNYQDYQNFYLVRFKTSTSSYQLIRQVNGENQTIVSTSNASETFVAGVPYRFTVTSTNAYEYDFTITRRGSSEVLNPLTHGVDGDGNFTNGYAGFYVSSANTDNVPDFKFDNFVLQQMDSKPAEIGDVTITFDGADAVFSWPGSASGTYALQKRGSLLVGDWSNVVENISGLDGTMYATNELSAAQGFYRIVIP